MSQSSLYENFNGFQQYTGMGAAEDESESNIIALPEAGLSIQVYGENLYVKRIYRLYKQVIENPGNAQVLKNVQQDIARRLNQAEVILDRYEGMQVSADVERMHEGILNGFSCYYDGLAAFLDYFVGYDQAYLLDSLELISQGDSFINDIQDEVQEDDDNECMRLVS